MSEFPDRRDIQQEIQAMLEALRHLGAANGLAEQPLGDAYDSALDGLTALHLYLRLDARSLVSLPGPTSPHGGQVR